MCIYLPTYLYQPWWRIVEAHGGSEKCWCIQLKAYDKPYLKLEIEAENVNLLERLRLSQCTVWRMSNYVGPRPEDRMQLNTRQEVQRKYVRNAARREI